MGEICAKRNPKYIWKMILHKHKHNLFANLISAFGAYDLNNGNYRGCTKLYIECLNLQSKLQKRICSQTHKLALFCAQKH